MMQIAINTSQNVNIKFTIASIGERILAYLIDLLIKGAYLIFIFFFLFEVFSFDLYINRLDQWSTASIFIIIYLPVIFYRLVLESLFEGQTLGKMVMKIKVVKIDGYQANFGDYLMRWLFTIIDISLSFGGIAIITMIINKNHQRLGDIAAGTSVISLKNKVNISHTILEVLSEDYKPTFPQVIALSDNDMRIIKENYQRAYLKNDFVIIKKLSQKIKESIKLDKLPDGLSNERFINIVIKDYNYYTGQDA